MLFKEVIGQERVKQRLIQTVKDNRVSHAQLFLGPEGSGALPLAMAYSQYIVCENKLEKDSCGKCRACIKNQKLVHPDIHFVYPIISSKDIEVSTDLISQWREAFLENPYINLFQWYQYLDAENKQGIINAKESAEILRKLSLTTYESEFKIIIIWMPEKLHITAANKLLKILEEPFDKTLFILVCENEDQILRTILSRTQLIKINKIADDDLTKTLREATNIPAEKTLKIVHMADGNYNTALQIINESDPDNEQDSDFNFSGFQKWMRACFKFEGIKILSWVDEISSQGREKQKNFLSYTLQLVRECLIFNYGQEQMVKLEGSELEFIKKFAPFINPGNAELFSEELSKAHYHIERNANPKILFFDLSFKINELLNMGTKNS